MRYAMCAVALAVLASPAVAQEKTVRVPAGVKVEGMPPIPQTIADDLARYASFREAQMIAWHPTKRQRPRAGSTRRGRGRARSET